VRLRGPAPVPWHSGMRISTSGGSISSFALRLVLGWIGASGQPAHAVSIALSPLTLSQPATGIVWDATRSRFFVSSGTNVFMINPESAQIEDTIAVGNPSYQIAVSEDGQYLYVALGSEPYPESLGLVNRYRIQSHSLDLQIPLGAYTGGNIPRGVQAMVVLPGQPTSILAGTTDQQVMVFDGAVPRSGIAALRVRSLYVRPSDGAIFGLGDVGTSAQIFWFNVSSDGVAPVRSVPVDPNWDAGTVTWNGNLVSNTNTFRSSVFDLVAGATIGYLNAPVTASPSGACVLSTDNSGTSAIMYQYAYGYPSTTSLVQYSLANFQKTASADVTGMPPDYNSVAGLCSGAWSWGADGLLIRGNGDQLYFVHASGLSPVTPAPIPAPTQDASGVIHLALPANGLIYDSGRNLLWASIPGNAGAAGDSVVSIDPATGNVIDTIYAGSEPGALALSADGSHMFAALGGEPAIASVDLSAKKSSAFSVLDASSPLYWSAIGVTAIAGQSNSVVAVRSANGPSSSVVAYDAGLPRENSFDNVNMYSQYVQTIFPADAPNAYYAADTAIHYGDGTHDVFRLIVNSSGVELDAQLNNLLLGAPSGTGSVPGYNQPVSMAHDPGRLFTSAGQVVTPDTKQILGVFALAPAYGLPVPFSDRNGVVYVQSAVPQVTANFYDLGTFRPQLSVPLVTGPDCGCTSDSPSPVNVVAAVRAGSNAIAITANNQIAIAPLPSFQPWPTNTGQLQTDSAGVQHMDLPVNAIRAIPGTGKLAMSTSGALGSIGNSIVVYNPASGTIESAAFIGSEPTLLAPSPDGTAVYAYLSGEERIGRLNIAAQSRDLDFAPNPYGAGNQTSAYDMAVGADGGLAVSYNPGPIAIFDNGALRPQVDWNGQGEFAGGPATFVLAFNDAGSLLYGFNSFLSTADLKRSSVSPQGLQWISSVGGLIGEYTAEIRQAGGLLYASDGWVVDPERSRLVGKFVWPNPTFNPITHVVPDVAAGRLYATAESGDSPQAGIFDLHTHAFLGSISLSLKISSYPTLLSLVQYSGDGLALTTSGGQVLLVRISAIPLLPSPVASPQPPPLPSTPFVNVNVIDVAASDLAYDSTRNLLYASVPNSEAAMGDKIVALDPATGAIKAQYNTDINPRLLAISADNTELFFTVGMVGNYMLSGFSLVSESAQMLDLASGNIGPKFGTLPSSSSSSYAVLSLTVPAEQPQSLELLQNLWESVFEPDGTVTLVNGGPDDIRAYDNGTQRPNILGPGSFNCNSIQAGAAANRLYCASSNNFSRLTADSTGISILDSFPLPAGNGAFNGFVFSNGKVYTTTGLVIDPEAKQVIASVEAQGPVAVDGGRIYWLDTSDSVFPGVDTASQDTLALRSFDATTLQPIDVRLINVAALDVTRLVPCGQGRLAFRAGSQIYIVSPAAASAGAPAITQVSPNDSASPVVQPGAWMSIYGSNLANGIAVWNNNFPTSLGGVSVTVDGKPAYLAYVSPTQINAQAPDDATEGLVTVTVSAPNGTASATVLLSSYDPSFSLFDAKHVAGIIPTPDGSGHYGNGTYDILGPAGQFSFTARPVKVGETLEVFGMGFGPTSSNSPAGQPFTGTAFLNYQMTLKIGGALVSPTFSGLIGSGIYQFTFVVPTMGSGDQLIQAIVNGNGTTPPAYVTVQ